MNSDTAPSSSAAAWAEANQRCLMAELAVLRATLQRHAERDSANAGDGNASRDAYEECRRSLNAPSALDQLCSIFGLSTFERATLLLCAGIELDSAFAAQCAAAQGERKPGPTFSLALTALPEPHWSALTPNAPLRYWHLIELGGGSAVTTSSLRIDERILHFLAGVGGMDERLAGYVEPVNRPESIASAHETLGERIAHAWSRCENSNLPLIQLFGREAVSKRHVAAEACASLGLKLWCLHADRLPASVAELELLQRFWERESILSGAALLLEYAGFDNNEAVRTHGVMRHWIERSRSPLLLSTPEPLQGVLRTSVNLDVRRPSALEQRELWKRALGEAGTELNGELDRIISHFDLSAPAIHAVCAQLVGSVQPSASEPADSVSAESLWQACRSESRSKIDDLAQRIDSKVMWDDLVLPEPTMAVLREIAAQVRHRARVYETWGFAAKSARGLGIGAMFSGPSGTGKTLAAEVLANELELDLYRIDLSQVVSKYIGETEKNLRRVFDAAEECGAVLLFDEADALFGKRSEVKDSHDRYANIEVSYLLQRMEGYRGLAILTTNMKDALDPAFLRRIRFAIQFPFPDANLRSEIWRRVFPPATPTDALDAVRLARLNVPGGNIRNMALSAAFHAAELGEPVRMCHLLRAARSEFAKLEKPLPEAEIGGWA
jgi:hypothetical protein